jgi:hypothetical protein
MDFTVKERYSIKFCMKFIPVISHDKYYSQFNTLLVKWYNNRLLPLIRQVFLIPNGINEFVDQTLMFHLLLESVLPEFDHYLEIYTFSALQ